MNWGVFVKNYIPQYQEDSNNCNYFNYSHKNLPDIRIYYNTETGVVIDICCDTNEIIFQKLKDNILCTLKMEFRNRVINHILEL